MSRRTPPSAREVVTALTAKDTRFNPANPREPILVDPFGQDRAMKWDDAVQRVRRTLRTTRLSAQQWIKNMLADPDSDLVGITVEGGVAHRMVTTVDDPRVDRDDMGWPEEVRRALRFDHTGHLLDVNTSPLPTSQIYWLLSHTTLPVLRAAVERQLQERAHKQAVTQAELDAAFVTVHGEDLVVFLRLIEGIADPFTGEHDPGKIITTGVATGDTLAGICGTNGRLTIDLWGTQITEVAERLRTLLNTTNFHTRAEPDTTDTANN